MITFLLKASLILAVLWLFYKLVLEKESFFAANRIYLFGSILLAFSLPFLPMPELVEKQGFLSPILEVSEEVQSQHSVPPSQTGEQMVLPHFQTPSERPLPLHTSSHTSAKGLFFWIFIAYCFGVVIFGLNLLTQLGSIGIRIWKSEEKIPDIGYTIIHSPDIQEPCSFFRYVFINPESYEYETYEQILAHEEIHVKKWHSLDLLLAEICTIFLWFNPFAWVFRKEVEKNLEYQTDYLLLQETPSQKEHYQMSLLKVATYRKPLAITTNYNQSLLKKRIQKMNAKQSNSHSYWKYAFVAPVLFFMLLILNEPASFAQIQEGEVFNFDRSVDMNAEMQVDYPVEFDVERKNEINESAEEQLEQEVEVQMIQEQQYEEIQDRITEPKQVLPPQGKELIRAVQAGDLRRVKELVERGVDINLNKYGVGTALIIASRRGDMSMIKYLNRQGADLNIDSYGIGTALIAATKKQQWEVVEYLATQGADLNVNSYGLGTALIAALRKDDTKGAEYLIDWGADLNVDSYGIGTALMVAVKQKDRSSIRYLISKGADLDVNSYGVGTALMIALKKGERELAEWLIENGADVNVDSYGIGTAMIAAVRSGNGSTAKFLLDRGADIDANSYGIGTALIAALRKGDQDMVGSLLKHGADPNKDSYGIGNALMVAAKKGQLSNMKLMIRNGAKIDETSYGLGTALTVAVRNNQVHAAELLLDHGANPDQTSWGVESAAHYAKESNNPEMMRLFDISQREY